MGRLHSQGKGISSSTCPYRRSAPHWLQLSAEKCVQMICDYAKKGVRPSQIGALLRDRNGVGMVRAVTGVKVLRILKANGLAPALPEELYHLIKKATNVRKHLEHAKHDVDGKYRLILIESRIHRLTRYYKTRRVLAPNWKYNAQTASALVA
ncbi:40S ribosomal protein S13, putative [Trichomonas vaginalis G3]|uniref:40S ribosomal protein S13, putative n=1 Tax=Trichomonas vaginalis (strain ATCC PRA-98 / G3) TaxID=412133 RepID=A2E469_TRIV3|nr:Chain N 40s Ribosomal Protein S13 [Trichomonas vaginalis G3]EAY12515.1 40S ribosomal protein S13, putative [Trichomonas vaginalis G3]KAI5554052.1 Chain N 40s Ribosomal Protein S13 [Trichomonas vaginalis G3]|eukprot:XP_001324738.1 40S ribosomal protein S13 [Trichomonas vaginalis G3]